MALYLKMFPERGKRYRNLKPISVKDSTLAVAIFTGIFNGMGSISILALALLNFVAIGSVIISAEAAVVILLGYIFYKERFGVRQIIGFVLMVAGVVVLSSL